MPSPVAVIEEEIKKLTQDELFVLMLLMFAKLYESEQREMVETLQAMMVGRS